MDSEALERPGMQAGRTPRVLARGAPGWAVSPVLSGRRGKPDTKARGLSVRRRKKWLEEGPCRAQLGSRIRSQVSFKKCGLSARGTWPHKEPECLLYEGGIVGGGSGMDWEFWLVDANYESIVYSLCKL